MKMLALVSWTCLAAFAACGLAEPIQNEVVDVVATGSGLSPDEAEKDALRNAVETVVGQYVGTSTTVEENANVAMGTTYLFEGEGASMILSAFSSRMVAKKCVRASLKASDEEMGMGVDEKNYTPPSPVAGSDGEFGPFIRFGYCNDRVAIIAPSVSFKFFEEHFNSPKPIDVVVGLGNDSARLDLGEFTPEQLRAVTSVECNPASQ